MSLLTHWDGEPVQVWARIWRAPLLEAHDLLPSTNDRAREVADEGAGPFSVILADEQTAGRGRSGRAWHSRPGAGLFLSTLLPGSGTPPLHLPLLVGLAAARAVESASPRVGVGLKWPNDLILQGRKVGGILCERHHGAVVTGIGLNVRHRAADFPPELAGIATSLEATTRKPVSIGSLVTALLRELHVLCSLPAASLPGELHEELTARDVLKDVEVSTRVAGRGVARGIDTDGALLLEGADGTVKRVVAGSVRAL
ncbi:MAG: biotin--[acetyl-CoA-carboxylase] ligase [Gemmatimonadetes bacterium]|nr:biotin--[acetyl-CoA-carboxylase] ligase [Gemmatimonadota bacterium]